MISTAIDMSFMVLYVVKRGVHMSYIYVNYLRLERYIVVIILS